MLFDAMLAGKVRDVGLIVDGPVAAPVNGAVDEVLDAILQCCIDEPLALLFFIRSTLLSNGRRLQRINVASTQVA